MSAPYAPIVCVALAPTSVARWDSVSDRWRHLGVLPRRRKDRRMKWVLVGAVSQVVASIGRQGSAARDGSLA